jgi:hypothetical protein
MLYYTKINKTVPVKSDINTKIRLRKYLKLTKSVGIYKAIGDFWV